MTLKRILGSLTAIVALSAAAFLYSAHPVKSSDHQDTYNLATRSNTSADITDVYVFPSPSNPNNVVFVMDVSPLIPAGMGASKFFDPSVMWQFKIVHGPQGTTNPEDQVIQLGVTGTDAGQLITVFGPTSPNPPGVNNSFVSSPAGTLQYNVPRGTQLSNGIVAFAGPRADPFFFDLFAFFKFLGDRNYQNHTSQNDPGTGQMLTGTPTFNGYPGGTVAGPAYGNYACSTAPPQNALTDINGGFNVLSFVLEVPKSLLTTGFSSPIIHVWATAGSSSGK